MTNKEYIESQNISFSEGLKLWDKNRYPDFSDWLKAERTHKYKIGDVFESRKSHTKYVVIGVDVKGRDTGFVYAYNAIGIYANGCVVFASNEDVENGEFRKAILFSGECDTDPNFVKIA